MIDILTRRRQNNPILTGEAGVGKTAVVEGFALRIAAGRRARRRCKNVDRPHARPRPAAGRRRRQGRVREPAQVGHRRGEGVAEADHPVHRRGPHDDRRRRRRPGRATPPTCSSRRWRAASCAPSPPPPGPSTRSTSRRTPRSTRRFQVVKVEEPTDETRHRDDARPRRRCWRSTTASASSTRPSRPRSSSRTATSPAASCPTRRSACSTPPAPAWRSASADARRPSRTAAAQIEHLDVEIGILERETRRRRDARRAARRADGAELRRPRARLDELETRWKTEKKLVDEIREPARASSRQRTPADGRRRSADRADATKLQAELDAQTPSSRKLQGETPLMQAVRRSPGRSPRSSPAGPASRSARWSPTRSRPCSNLEDQLERARHRPDARPRGDRPAHPHRARRTSTTRARPIGVFLLVGPSGVGKTETAIALADIALRRRAQHDRHQHVGVQGGAHGLAPEGLAARATSATARAAC